MTIQACYQQLGGDYDKVRARLLNEKLVEKFIAKFLDDDSYEKLCRAMREGDRAQAFLAAHTLKGVCANLNLDRLFDSASRLTELLRPEADVLPEEAVAVMEELRANYELTTNTIRAYLRQDEPQAVPAPANGEAI